MRLLRTDRTRSAPRCGRCGKWVDPATPCPLLRMAFARRSRPRWPRDVAPSVASELSYESLCACGVIGSSTGPRARNIGWRITDSVGLTESKARAVGATRSMPARCVLGRGAGLAAWVRRKRSGRRCGAVERVRAGGTGRRAAGEKGSGRAREGGFSGSALRLRSAVAFWRRAG
jgi:hypothetical protein